MKAKLFQFHENYRPPYYGTWRKRSAQITGRRPFGKSEVSLLLTFRWMFLLFFVGWRWKNVLKQM